MLMPHDPPWVDAQVLVELVITKDNGEIETFNPYRVQHSNSRGPYKGGLRYHPQVDLDDVRRYAHLSLAACAAPPHIAMTQVSCSHAMTTHPVTALCRSV